MKSKYELWGSFDHEPLQDTQRRISRQVMSERELKDRGLYFWPGDVVELVSFRDIHQVELPDGRRFRSEDCALNGLDHQAASLARTFWRAKGE